VPAAPRLVIWFDPDARDIADPKLCWEVALCNVDQDGNGDAGRVYVDARTGAVVRYDNDKHACAIAGCMRPARGGNAALPVPTTVTVMAWAKTAASAAAAPVNVPMARCTVAVPGIGLVTTDANGQFTLDLTAPVTITVTNLDGAHHAPIQPALASPASVVVNPGVPTVLQLFGPAAADTELAHSNTAHWIDQTNEWGPPAVPNEPAPTTVARRGVLPLKVDREALAIVVIYPRRALEVRANLAAGLFYLSERRGFDDRLNVEDPLIDRFKPVAADDGVTRDAQLPRTNRDLGRDLAFQRCAVDPAFADDHGARRLNSFVGAQGAENEICARL
jgi:hypothetical protein